jgi:hypothetical protein
MYGKGVERKEAHENLDRFTAKRIETKQSKPSDSSSMQERASIHVTPVTLKPFGYLCI